MNNHQIARERTKEMRQWLTQGTPDDELASLASVRWGIPLHRARRYVAKAKRINATGMRRNEFGGRRSKSFRIENATTYRVVVDGAAHEMTTVVTSDGTVIFAGASGPRVTIGRVAPNVILDT